MGRPKRPFNGVEGITLRYPLWMAAEAPGALGRRQKTRWESSRHWHYTVANGVFDPLTYLFVLDAVANIEPDIELRASNLRDWLNVTMTQFSWDAITVGRVLSDLCDEMEKVLGKKNGLLERGRDYKGVFYNIHANPETAELYYALREELMTLSQARIKWNRDNPGSRIDPVSPLLECPSLRGEWEEIA